MKAILRQNKDGRYYWSMPGANIMLGYTLNHPAGGVYVNIFLLNLRTGEIKLRK